MKTNDLIRLGVTGGEATRLADEFIRAFIAQGNDPARLELEIVSIVAKPTAAGLYAPEATGAVAPMG